LKLEGVFIKPLLRCRAKIPIKGIERKRGALSRQLGIPEMQSKNPNKGNWKLKTPNSTRPYGTLGCRAKIPIKGIESISSPHFLFSPLGVMQSKNPNKGNWKKTLSLIVCPSANSKMQSKNPNKGNWKMYSHSHIFR